MRRLIIILLLASSFCWAEERANNGVLAIVIAAKQQADSLKITPEKLKLIYLRKQIYWPNGQRIQPVNLQSEHPLRLQFSQAVLGSAPSAQIKYWNEQYFNGIRPPHVVNSEEAVMRYVAQTEASIAYVDACHVDARVQAVLWLDKGKLLTQAPLSLACSPNP